MQIIIFLSLIAALIPCTYFDVKYKEIPIFIMPISLALNTVLNIIYFNTACEQHKFFLLNILLGGAVFGVLTLILALKGFLGGADVILIACTAFSVGGLHMVEIIIMACIAGIVFAIIKRQKKGFPFAPFLLIATIIDLAITVLL